MTKIGKYIGGVLEVGRVSGPFGLLLIVLWAALPVGVVTIYHPEDAVGFHAWLQGLAIPEFLNTRQLIAGEIYALLSLVILFLLHLGTVTLIYRRAQFYVQLW